MTQGNGKTNVLIGVCGSIAAYKSVELIRKLIKRGLNVRVIMTKSATNFIAPLTFEVITGNPVVIDFWDDNNLEGINHIELGSWADIIAIVPATADTIAKMVSGQADSELLATLLVTKAPIIVAPAMNVNMLEHPATQENLEILKSRGAIIINPGSGELACGWNGSGRLADIYEIRYAILKELREHSLKGKRIVVTAGPTREMIDPVRFISNCSSGKMGVEIAKEAYLRGADVTLIHGPISFTLPSAIKRIPIISARDLEKEAVKEVYDSSMTTDILIMVAAVADYRPKIVEEYKIKKQKDPESLPLTINPDVLKILGDKRRGNSKPYLVGFAVETGEPEDLIGKVQEKIINKKVDLIVGNLAHEVFDLNTNHVWIVDKIGRQEEVMTTFKSRVAKRIFDNIERNI